MKGKTEVKPMNNWMKNVCMLILAIQSWPLINSSFYFSKNIQKNSTGHCSIEDAKTVMELVKRKFEAGRDLSCFYFPTFTV